MAGKTMRSRKNNSHNMGYQARKAGSSRKGKNKKQTGGAITARNKDRRQKAHAKKLEKEAARKNERLELLDQVKAQYPNRKIGDLLSEFGTLTICRLTAILNGTYMNKPWYVARMARKQVENKATIQPKRAKKNVQFSKHRKNKDNKKS